MAIGDCTRLVEKIISRIRSWGARSLSYAGRLILVQSVLSQLHSYWTRIFIIPLTVIDRVERICRNYLWSGSDLYLRAPAVAWEKVCREKKCGGLGVVSCREWNIAMLGKYVWWIAAKADHLWIRWVNHIYIKNQPWMDYKPTTTTSWTWRKICHVKDQFKDGYVGGNWCRNQGRYTVADGYSWLQPEAPKVTWYPLIWNASVVPKHAYIGWLAMQGRLLTKDRLGSFGIQNDGQCEICQAHLENHTHMLYLCCYSQHCWSLLWEWLDYKFPLIGLCDWFRRWRCKTLIKKQIIAAAIVGLIYHIWFARNICRLEARLQAPWAILKQLKVELQARFQRPSKIELVQKSVWACQLLAV
ncbi:uncharacterized protein LOC141588205 [Silene latifolia]|uniref:uncharacterized protein LOC141588205 n=1 Tax=Silene latifolia TaxID=37657 RepID=UPI003D78956B